jgi:hypothetical protein
MKDSQVKRTLVVTALLAVLAIVSMISIAYTAHSYGRAMEVVRGFRLELGNLRLEDSADPSIAVVLRLVNDSAVGLDLESLRFSLHLNDQFVGSNYEPFSTSVPARLAEKSLEFAIPVDVFYQQFLDQAEAEGTYAWSVRGRYNIVLPFKEKPIWLDLQGQWSGR